MTDRQDQGVQGGAAKTWTLIRDIISFCAGIGIMVFEAGWRNSDRPWLFAVAVAMMGLPAAFSLDRLYKLGPGGRDDDRGGPA